ncbi:hypothetical protein L6164_020807 [Bauhinia variegata]|uniref:Uncharacterized protein n=1 Tax=Bauhinia variegata TaxID=167791 RepID=A0ACB9MW65_BAUVA|nr:hypothetical protein L6164_020807 [Bauhinia variegata]
MTSDVRKIAGKSYDYIVVGGGTSGCPLAATLSEKFSVLLVERDKYSSVAQSFVSEDGVSNGGLYSRASEEFINEAGWDRELLKEAYEWVESKVVLPPVFLSPWQSVAEFSLLEAGILPYNGYSLEDIKATKVSGSVFNGFVKRHTSADLLEAGIPENLTVLLNATVKSVIFHPNGALGSPQILLLNGIAPKEDLRKLNIPVMLDLKEAGQGMQDNPSVGILLDTMPQKRLPDPPQAAGIADGFKIIVEGAIVPISTNATRVGISGKIAFLSSKGILELNDTDPRLNPLVKFNYLASEADMEECVKMTQLLNRIAKSKSTALFLGTSGQSNLTSTKDLRRFCRKKMLKLSIIIIVVALLDQSLTSNTMFNA